MIQVKLVQDGIRFCGKRGQYSFMIIEKTGMSRTDQDVILAVRRHHINAALGKRFTARRQAQEVIGNL